MSYTDAVWLEIQDEADLIERVYQSSPTVARIAATAIMQAAIIEAENERSQSH